MIKVIVGGDYFVSNNSVNTEIFDKSVIDLFQSADFKIVNLECPITDLDKESRILKSGPHLKSSDKVTAVNLKKIGVNVVTLANNHIKDYGEKGVMDTLSFCKQNNLNTVGAGENIEDASKILYLKKDDLKIAVINISENEWSSADANSAGAYPLDIIDNSKLIDKAKKNANKVIVIIHGGIEHYNLPTPRMVKQYRFYADCGASIIIGHHTHCIGGNEVYKGVPIIYSLGNFVFTKKSNEKGWYIGLLLKMEITKSAIKWNLHPTNQNKITGTVELLKNEKKEFILNNVIELSSKISNKVVLENEWKKFLSNKKREYLSSYVFTNAIPSKYIRALLSRLGVYNLVMTKRHLAFLINLIRCESHQEASIDILLNEISKK